jgi:hypothetical protein
MDSDIDDLKKMAAPNSERIALATEELVKEQIITNNLLCALCDLKESQNYHDDVFLKAWVVKTTHNTYFNTVGLTVSFSAIYIAITSLGVNNSFFSGVSILWNAFKGLF